MQALIVIGIFISFVIALLGTFVLIVSPTEWPCFHTCDEIPLRKPSKTEMSALKEYGLFYGILVPVTVLGWIGICFLSDLYHLMF